MITSFFPLSYTNAALVYQFSLPRWSVSQGGLTL